MSADRERQFAVAYASIIFLKEKSKAVSSLHRLCIAFKSCYRSYIATEKAEKIRKKQTTTLKLLMAKPRYEKIGFLQLRS